jgi:hypothetical protein
MCIQCIQVWQEGKECGYERILCYISTNNEGSGIEFPALTVYNLSVSIATVSYSYSFFRKTFDFETRLAFFFWRNFVPLFAHSTKYCVNGADDADKILQMFYKLF